MASRAKSPAPEGAFNGFPQAGLDFLKELENNNNREWFQPRKPLFEETLKQPMTLLVEALNDGLQGFAPQYMADPAKAIFRFYRDTRFSRDKSPYKDHVGAIFPRRGAGWQDCGSFYIEVSNRGVGLGGGIYMPPPEALALLRHHLAENYQEFQTLTGSRAAKALGPLQGERLTRPPKGWPADHPAADVVRYKQLYYYLEMPAQAALQAELVKEALRVFRLMLPFVEFINTPFVRKPLSATEESFRF